jgi:hypothetical protein
MGIILFFVAFILAIALAPLGVFASIVILIVQASKFRFLYTFKKHTNEMFFQGAIAIDVFGNVFFKHLFNWALIKGKNLQIFKNGMVTFYDNKHRFGKQGETISSVLGKNQRENTLTKVGKGLALLLDTLDPNHCFKSIQE